MMHRVRFYLLAACTVASNAPFILEAQTKQQTSSLKHAAVIANDSNGTTAAERALLEADEQFFLRRLKGQRTAYLKKGSWADLGSRCNPGALRIFPKDTSVAQRDSLQRLVEHMEQTVVARGVGARLDTQSALLLIRTIVGWEAGIDRPTWDSDEARARFAVATGLTGDVPDPRGTGCLASPLERDTVTFVLPGFATMDFPKASHPRVKAYFGRDAGNSPLVSPPSRG